MKTLALAAACNSSITLGAPEPHGNSDLNESIQDSKKAEETWAKIITKEHRDFFKTLPLQEFSVWGSALMSLSEHIRKGSMSKKRVHFREFKLKEIYYLMKFEQKWY